MKPAFWLLPLVLLANVCSGQEELPFDQLLASLTPMEIGREHTPQQAAAIKRYNKGVEDLKEVCAQYYLDNKVKFQRVHVASKKLVELEGDLAPIVVDQLQKFAHFEIVKHLEKVVKFRKDIKKATEQDVRLARQLCEWTEPAFVKEAEIAAAEAKRIGAKPLVLPRPRLDFPQARPVVESGKISLKLLEVNTNIHNHTGTMSRSGRYWIIAEQWNPQEPIKYALWDLDQGKMLRYLSMEVGKPTRPYAGNDQEDFGAAITIHPRLVNLAFTPDEKLIVGIKFVTNHIYVWERETGKLLRVLDNIGNGSRFVMVDNQRIAAETPSEFAKGTPPVDLINFETGKLERLVKPGNYGGAQWWGGFARGNSLFMIWPAGFNEYDLRTRQEDIQRYLRGILNDDERNPSNGYLKEPARIVWNTKDGEYILSQGGRYVQVWDAKARRLLVERTIEHGADRKTLTAAEDAELLVQESPDKSEFELLDMFSAKVHLSIPTNYMRFQGISADGRRFARGQTSARVSRYEEGKPSQVLVLDFEHAPPSGKLDLKPLLENAKPTR